MQVWKYQFPIEDHFTLTTKVGARPLHIEMQRNGPCIWMLVDPNAEDFDMNFRLAGTGHDIPEAETEKPIGSFLMDGGRFVWHVFQLN